ncbi:hypothetical protein BpHYR1_045605 [Brachionus plicatilis]|uniref:Uncharacterized protein n=1 Tax=Brachionus plicatilis TaxID=10195 RepID=A0A3M7S671_BRAPC|nr:hypothetical protein BpHYR1_045605 [Brachionus plicatilis]
MQDSTFHSLAVPTAACVELELEEDAEESGDRDDDTFFVFVLTLTSLGLNISLIKNEFFLEPDVLALLSTLVSFLGRSYGDSRVLATKFYQQIKALNKKTNFSRISNEFKREKKKINL